MSADTYDLIVIGAGPAGLIWIDHARQMNKRILLIDQGLFENPSYSSINTPWNSNPEVQLGGVGGTANAWQGQCVPLDENQFKEIFAGCTTAEYKDYVRESQKISKKLSIKIDKNTKRMERIARKELNLKDDIKVKFSYMPVEQNWRRIFRKTLKYKHLHKITGRVESMGVNGRNVSAIILHDGREILLNASTKVALATNSIATANILSSIKDSQGEELMHSKVQVFDHPWRTKNRYHSKGNKFAKRKIFTFHIGLTHRMHTKYKFEVTHENRGIGVFELRPEFRGSVISKVIARGSQKILGFSVINPSWVDVWCQIAQQVPVNPLESTNLDEALDSIDVDRICEIEERSREILTQAGYVFDSSNEYAQIEQAFHTTGTVRFSSQSIVSKFEYIGTVGELDNLYFSGGAGLGNCSWANPTFSIMVLASMNAKLAIHNTLEI
jgi:hypothetical protein